MFYTLPETMVGFTSEQWADWSEPLRVLCPNQELDMLAWDGASIKLFNSDERRHKTGEVKSLHYKYEFKELTYSKMSWNKSLEEYLVFKLLKIKILF